jgi:hypothetical protein
MIRLSFLHRFRFRARSAALLAAAVLVCTPPARTQDEAPPWRAQVALSALYDNNVLRYSDKYLGRFENREDEGRFHIGTADDLLFHTTFHLERSLNPFGDLASVLSGDLHLWNYTHNSIKNWWTFTVAARQELPERIGISAAYSHIPEFYVRHYSDDDWAARVGQVPSRFQPFSFTKDEFRIGIQQQLFQSSRIRLTYASQRYYYNEHYTEYDSRNAVWGIDAAQPLFSTLRLSAAYAYTTSEAAGVDQPGEMRASSDDADGSFNEDSYSATLTWRLPRFAGLSTRLTLDGEYSRRCFTSSHFYALDPQHAGRIDYEYQASLEWSVRFGDDWETTLGYAWRMRDTRTSAPENQTFISDEKNYREYQVELGVAYDFAF